MSRSGARLQCAACEMDIDASPVYHLGLAYCCEGCSAGGPCTCTYDERTAAQAADWDAVDNLGLAFSTRPSEEAIATLRRAARETERERVAAR